MKISTILILAFAAGCLLVLGLYQSLTALRTEPVKRLQKLLPQPGEEFRQRNLLADLRFHLVRLIGLLLGRLRLTTRLEELLTQADIPLSAAEYVLLAGGAGFTFSLFLFSLTGNRMIFFIFLLATPFLAYQWLLFARQRRTQRFNHQLGEALVMMANCLRAGFSFLQAMDTVRREMPPPISHEFGRTFQEISLGTSTEEALSNLNHRVNSEDLHMVITAVLIQRRVGGNLAEVLENIATTIRERVRIKGEVRTLTAQGRISGLLIGLLPLALGAILTVINPSYISLLFTHPLGRVMLLAAIGMQLTGMFLIQKIVNVKV